MKKKNSCRLYVALFMLVMFVLWTIAISVIDLKAIGPNGSLVGFSSINGFIHKLTGVNMVLYHITDWLGFVPILVVFGFAVLGIVQWNKRKKLSKVDYSLFILGGFYIVVMSAYIVFEIFTVNYRPVLIEGILEASYPSSTTLLVMNVMPTLIMQIDSRIKNIAFKTFVDFIIILFILFMVIGRLISGVHWFTDIVGGVLLSVGLVMMYQYFVDLKE